MTNSEGKHIKNLAIHSTKKRGLLILLKIFKITHRNPHSGRTVIGEPVPSLSKGSTGVSVLRPFAVGSGVGFASPTKL